MPTQHFLVPIDFSAYADHALAYAIRLAGTLDARLTLLYVMQPVPMAGVDMGVTCLRPTCRRWKKPCRAAWRPHWHR